MDRIVEIQAPKATGLVADLNRVIDELTQAKREINLTQAGAQVAVKRHIQISIHILRDAISQL